MNMVKKVVGTLILPLAMFFIMMIICYSNGKMYYGTFQMWKSLIVDIAVSVTCAMGIGLQFKSGRFDFSGGAIMLLAAIISGNVASNSGNSPIILILCSMALCIGLSIGVALLYVYGRLPIIIATIGIALLYESITTLIYNGSGINLVANVNLRVFSSYPGVLLPFVGAVAVYAIYSYGATTGKQGAILANNQQAAVNIGIKENKNIIISYIYSGIIFGFATAIYCSTGMHNASYSSLSTVSELFSNILPVFVGLLLAVFCGDTIGILMGSLAMCLMTFGLNAVLPGEYGTALSTMFTGLFMLLINIVAAQGTKFRWIWEVVKSGFKPRK